MSWGIGVITLGKRCGVSFYCVSTVTTNESAPTILGLHAGGASIKSTIQHLLEEVDA